MTLSRDTRAACVASLTDEPILQGSLRTLMLVRQAVKIPDSWHEKIHIGTLSIVEVVRPERMRTAHAEILPRRFRWADSLASRSMGLHVLVELHDAGNSCARLGCVRR